MTISYPVPYKEQLRQYSEELVQKYYSRWTNDRQGFRGIDDLKKEEALKLAGFIGLAYPNFDFEPLVEVPESEVLMNKIYRFMADIDPNKEDIIKTIEKNAITYFEGRINTILENALIEYQQCDGMNY